MGEYKLVVLTRPVEGREDEFNEWYSNKHLDDVLDIPGFTAAQRFKLKGDPTDPKAWNYFAIYEVSHEDPKSVIDEMLARVGTEKMRSEEHTSELQSLMRISYAVFCLKNKRSRTKKSQKHHAKTKPS